MPPSRLPAYLQLDRYHITPADIVQSYLKCSPGDIDPRVILMPDWDAKIFSELECEVIPVVNESVYHLHYRGKSFTLVRSGSGAPRAGDMMLALGCSPCQMLLFAGSTGGMLTFMKVGDLVLPMRSISGDGFSRYLSHETYGADCFLQPIFPDPEIYYQLQNTALTCCKEDKIEVHEGAVFSTDSILGEFSRLDRLNRDHECIAIEMETAAVFRAAELVKIRAAALLQLTDVPANHKTLFSGRTAKEIERYQEIRKKVVARILLETLYHYEL